MKFYVNKLPRYAGCESLDDIAKDHVTHTDRRADGSGQNKIDTDDRQHGCSLRNEYHYISGIHTNVTTVQLPSGQAWYSYLCDKPQNGGNDPVNCVSAPSAVTVLGGREGGIRSMHYERAPASEGVEAGCGTASAPLRCAGLGSATAALRSNCSSVSGAEDYRRT